MDGAPPSGPIARPTEATAAGRHALSCSIAPSPDQHAAASLPRSRLARRTRRAPGRGSLGRAARHPCAGRAHAQPEEHRPRLAQARSGGHHRPERLRQIQPGLRHLVCGGPAPLCRKSVDLRPPVSATDGQAGRGCDRGPVPRDLDRAEGHQPQPPLHGRHHHRDSRLPAPALRPRRDTSLPRPRATAGGHEREPDGRCHAGAPGRNTPDGAGTGRARSQGRVRRAVRADAGAGLCAIPHRWQGGRCGRSAGTEEDREARHRRCHRPAARASRHAAASGRKLRGGPAHRRRSRHRAGTRRAGSISTPASSPARCAVTG